MGLINYFKEVRSELRHVTWPSTRQTAVFTVIVIILAIGTAYFLGVFDFIFTRLLDILVF